MVKIIILKTMVIKNYEINNDDTNIYDIYFTIIRKLF